MSQQVTDTFADVNGTRLRYEDRGDGHPLVLIHGGLADMRMWDEHMEPLAEHCRVIRFDLRGFGESAMSAGSFSFSDDLAGLLGVLGITRAAVLGLSFGGQLALNFALEYPESVNALILAGPSLGGSTPAPDTLRRIEEIDSLLDGGNVDAAVELELQLWVDGPERSPTEVDPVVRERIRVMNRHNYAVESDAGTPVWPEIPAAERLHEIRVPTLIVVGAVDLPHVLEVAVRLERDIPQARLRTIPDTAHHAPNERPEDFTSMVLDFLEGIGL